MAPLSNIAPSLQHQRTSAHTNFKKMPVAKLLLAAWSDSPPPGRTGSNLTYWKKTSVERARLVILWKANLKNIYIISYPPCSYELIDVSSTLCSTAGWCCLRRAIMCDVFSRNDALRLAFLSLQRTCVNGWSLGKIEETRLDWNYLPGVSQTWWCWKTSSPQWFSVMMVQNDKKACPFRI